MDIFETYDHEKEGGRKDQVILEKTWIFPDDTPSLTSEHQHDEYHRFKYTRTQVIRY